MARGERLEKATPDDYRLWFSYFFFFGILMFVSVFLGAGFLKHASTLSIWVGAVIVISLMAFGLVVWAKRIPAPVSLVLGIITWVAFIWLALIKTHVL
jgi:hypothetical protein